VPYIVTTRYRSAHTAAFDRVRSRRAVATLDELEARLYNEVAGIHGEAFEPLCATIEDLCLRIDSGEESGGTVGPLPNGTVIEVERATWCSLDRAALIAVHGTTLDPVTCMDRSLDCPESQIGEGRQQQIIAAYNAAQGTT
jgi:hypothetical protein